MKTLDFSAALHGRITVHFLAGRTAFSEVLLHVRADFTPYLETNSSDFHSKGDFYILLGHLALSLEKGVLSISKFDIQK